MSVNQAASWEDEVTVSRNACQGQMSREKGQICFLWNTVCCSGPSFSTCGRLRPLGMLLFSTVCALLGSRFLSAFLCTSIEAVIPVELLVASIVCPPAVAVAVDCLKGVSVPLIMFCCSCTASRWRMAFFAFSNVRSESSCRRSGVTCLEFWRRAYHGSSRLPEHSWLQEYIEPWCTALKSRRGAGFDD